MLLRISTFWHRLCRFSRHGREIRRQCGQPLNVFWDVLSLSRPPQDTHSTHRLFCRPLSPPHRRTPMPTSFHFPHVLASRGMSSSSKRGLARANSSLRSFFCEKRDLFHALDLLFGDLLHEFRHCFRPTETYLVERTVKHSVAAQSKRSSRQRRMNWTRPPPSHRLRLASTSKAPPLSRQPRRGNVR